MDLINILEDLAKSRPAFHSEADFQHAYAWAIHETHPDADVRLEYRHPALRGRAYLDIWIRLGSFRVGVELKYKTRAVDFEYGAERFALLNQGAQDQGRYDYCRDVSRVEQIIQADPEATGYAIFLTNDSSYWKPKRSHKSVDDQFRLCEGSTLSGDLDWLPHASAGTKGGRDTPISIAADYPLSWEVYSRIEASRSNEFRYLGLKARAANGG